MDGRDLSSDYHTPSYGHGISPSASFATPPMPCYSPNSDKPSALPAWLLMEAEAAAVAAAAADRRVARYLGLLGAAVGAEALGARPLADPCDVYDMPFSSPEAARWSSQECDLRARAPLRRESWTSAEAALRYGGMSGPGSRGPLPAVAADSPAFAKRRGAHYDACVYEISSEGGSCQPSPEGPVLSLCGDLEEECGGRARAGDALTPLDLGDPAIDPAAARPAARTMVAAPLAAEESDAYADAGLDLGGGGGEAYHLATPAAGAPLGYCSAAVDGPSAHAGPVRPAEARDAGETAAMPDGGEGGVDGFAGADEGGPDFAACLIGGGGGACDVWLGGGGRGAAQIGDHACGGGGGGGGGSSSSGLMGDFDGGAWDALYGREEECSGWW